MLAEIIIGYQFNALSLVADSYHMYVRVPFAQFRALSLQKLTSAPKAQRHRRLHRPVVRD
jgi:Co/Zn/Cd efflux system component